MVILVLDKFSEIPLQLEGMHIPGKISIVDDAPFMTHHFHQQVGKTHAVVENFHHFAIRKFQDGIDEYNRLAHMHVQQLLGHSYLRCGDGPPDIVSLAERKQGVMQILHG